MSTAVRLPLGFAEPIARELLVELVDVVERAEVAGSIRRQTPDVGDIELVAIPRRATLTVPGLLEDEEREVDRLQERLEELLAGGILGPHPTDPKRGERYSKIVHRASRLQVDLFSARRDTFGLILLIRTGPARYSQWLVTEARARGFHVAEGELHRGGLSPIQHGRCERVQTPDEADVYAALGMPYTRPEDRA